MITSDQVPFLILSLSLNITEPKKKRVNRLALNMRATGFEPTTFWSVARRSIQLSYAHKVLSSKEYITTGKTEMSRGNMGC